MKRIRVLFQVLGCLLAITVSPSALAQADNAAPAASPATTPAADSDEQKEKELLDAFKKEQNITNTLGMILVWVPGGYRVAECETVQSAFEAIVGRNPSKFVGSRRPVERVTLADAAEFCRKLTEKERREGKLPKAFSYQLPSEEEFEAYAGSTPLTLAYVSLIGDRLSTIDVGSMGTNSLGLYDVRGNVWEWCSSGVARGSSYQSHEDYLNLSFRFVGKSDTALEDIGFRVVLKETGS